MNRTDLKKLNLPDEPGVYFFLGKNDKIIYIGKATSLKQRVASYFNGDLLKTRSPLIENMVEEAINVEFSVTDSVLEALLLETNLIRTHKPKFNTKSKDDKSYNHIVITKEKWPRILLVREKDLTEKFSRAEIDCHFGPFPSGGLLRDALKIIKKIFQFYDQKKPVYSYKSKLEKGKSEFNRQIGLYPDPNDLVTYQQTIRHLKLLFRGKKQTIIKELEKEMITLAKNQEFEKASVVKQKIFALKHIEEISLLKRNLYENPHQDMFRIEAYDVAHLGGRNMVGVMVVLNGDELDKAEYRKFKIVGIHKANDKAALKQILERRIEHKSWPLPRLIVVDGNDVQKSTAEEVLHVNNLAITVIAVTKDERHKPVKLLGDREIINHHSDQILLANAEAHRFAINFHRQKQRKSALV